MLVLLLLLTLYALAAEITYATRAIVGFRRGRFNAVDNLSQLLATSIGVAWLLVGLHGVYYDHEYHFLPFLLSVLWTGFAVIAHNIDERLRDAENQAAVDDHGRVWLRIPMRPTSRLSRWWARARGRPVIIARTRRPDTWFGRVVPYRFRRLHRWWARHCGLFWIPCPLCGDGFGAHEYRLGGPRVASVPDPLTPGTSLGICPRCTRAGRGIHGLDVLC